MLAGHPRKRSRASLLVVTNVRLLSAFAVIVLLAAIACGGAATASPAMPGPGASPAASQYVPGEILARFTPGLATHVIEATNAVNGAMIRRHVPGIDVYCLVLPERGLGPALAAYRANPNVVYAELNFLAYALHTPNDPLYAHQWGPEVIQAPSAWDVIRSASEVTIAVVDSGVDDGHPDLASGLTSGWNFDPYSPTYGTSDTSDDYGHGTAVAGIAAAVTDNAIGVASVSFSGTIMPVKVLDAHGTGTYDAVCSGIVWAADNGADVINLSLGGTSYSQALQDAVDYAYAAGCVLVAASGNDGAGTTYFPAGCDHVVAVGATDTSDEWASFSSYGSHVDLAAPGVDVLTTYRTSGGEHVYAYVSGTSAATPHVAGLAALAVAQHPDRTSAEVESVLEANADDVWFTGWDEQTGYGRINAWRVVTGAISGSVHDSTTGDPIEGALVEAMVAGTSVQETTTDAAGSYEFVGLAPGSYDVGASCSGYGTAVAEELEVRGGEGATGVDLTLIPAGEISGVVLQHGNMKPIRDASVEAVQNGNVFGGAVTGRDGTFLLGGLAPGDYDIVASKPGYQSATEPGVPTGTSELSLVLQKGGSGDDPPGGGKPPKKPKDK